MSCPLFHLPAMLLSALCWKDEGFLDLCLLFHCLHSDCCQKDKSLPNALPFHLSHFSTVNNVSSQLKPKGSEFPICSATPPLSSDGSGSATCSVSCSILSLCFYSSGFARCSASCSFSLLCLQSLWVFQPNNAGRIECSALIPSSCYYFHLTSARRIWIARCSASCSFLLLCSPSDRYQNGECLLQALALFPSSSCVSQPLTGRWNSTQYLMIVLVHKGRRIIRKSSLCHNNFDNKR